MMKFKGSIKRERVYLRDRNSISLGKTGKVFISDKMEIPKESTRIKDAKGNLSFLMDICRDGVQEYLANEIYDTAILKENGVEPNTILRVWRPPNVVFNQKNVDAHNGLALTREHPSEFVNTSNRPMLEKGFNRESRYNPEKSVISGLGFVTDPLMVAEVESGEYNEISDGYDTELEYSPGQVPENIDGFSCTDAGEEYDLIMTSYQPNHIAIVKEGRAGNARIHDKKGGIDMSGEKTTFLGRLLNRNNQPKVKDTLSKMKKSEVLKALADEEPDEEKKAALTVLASEEEEKEMAEDEQNQNANISDSEDPSQEEVAIGAQKRVVDSKPEEVVEMKISKTELANLITSIVDSAVKTRLGDGSKDIVTDMQIDGEAEPYVVDEYEIPEGEVSEEVEAEDADPIGSEDLYELAKNSQNPKVQKLARALAEEIEMASAANEGEEAVEAVEETEDAGFIADADSDTEEDRVEAAAEGKAPPAGPPSNQAVEKDVKAAIDGDAQQEPVLEKDGYFIPKKLADQAALPILMAKVINTVSSYGIQGIDVNTHLQDGTIYHRLIKASGIGKVTAPQGITSERVSMAINAIKANRSLVDGMSDLFKLKDSSKDGGFDPASEL